MGYGERERGSNFVLCLRLRLREGTNKTLTETLLKSGHVSPPFVVTKSCLRRPKIL